uniref:Uncharacterized protein n=1 Tax=Rhizophora mucronata TaxID=61149 RepID=A0A2P2N1H4_RHIMU
MYELCNGHLERKLLNFDVVSKPFSQVITKSNYATLIFEINCNLSIRSSKPMLCCYFQTNWDVCEGSVQDHHLGPLLIIVISALDRVNLYFCPCFQPNGLSCKEHVKG